MIMALIFFLGFCAALFALVVLIGRGRSRTTITGPLDREVDYDSPYGRGGYFWTGKRSK